MQSNNIPIEIKELEEGTAKKIICKSNELAF